MTKFCFPIGFKNFAIEKSISPVIDSLFGTFVPREKTNGADQSGAYSLALLSSLNVLLYCFRAQIIDLCLRSQVLVTVDRRNADC